MEIGYVEIYHKEHAKYNLSKPIRRYCTLLIK